MNEKLIEQQQQQIKNLSDEITLMWMKYEGIGSIYNRQHLQSQLDQANDKIRRFIFIHLLYFLGVVDR